MESELALKLIISITPIACAIGAYALTLTGRKLYADRLAKMSNPASMKDKVSVNHDRESE